MNRYVAAGVLADMRAGRRVVVLCGTRPLARLAFAKVAAGAVDGETVRRANGEERIIAKDGPGWVRFGRSGGTTFRGFSADVVLFDVADPDRDALDAAAAIIAAAPGGEVIRP